MDFKRNGRTWTGNIFHKFETICHEDTLKYLENQVQFVGEGVKKVYGNVLPDFIPSKKKNVARSAVGGGITRRHMFPSESQSCLVEDSVGPVDCKDHQNHINPSTCEEFTEKTNNILNQEDDADDAEKHSICRDLDCGDSPSSFTNKEKEEHTWTVGPDSIERSNGNDRTVEASNQQNNEVLGHGNDIHPEALVNFELLLEFQEEVYESYRKYESMVDNLEHCYGETKLKADMSTSNCGGEDDYAVDEKMETVDLTDEIRVEVVDDWSVHAASCRPRWIKSYKRLIKEAFGSRKRLIKEYEQLAILCEAVNSLKQEQEQSLVVTTPSPINDSCDDEWELV